MPPLGSLLNRIVNSVVEQVPRLSRFPQLCQQLFICGEGLAVTLLLHKTMRQRMSQDRADFGTAILLHAEAGVDFKQLSANPRLGLYLIGAFAPCIGVSWWLKGLYGVLAQMVGYDVERWRVRLALGETRQRILGMFLKQGNIACSGRHNCWGHMTLWVSRLAKKLLYPFKTVDPSTSSRDDIAFADGGNLGGIYSGKTCADSGG